jgi:hypothetical protein
VSTLRSHPRARRLDQAVRFRTVATPAIEAYLETLI